MPRYANFDNIECFLIVRKTNNDEHEEQRICFRAELLDNRKVGAYNPATGLQTKDITYRIRSNNLESVKIDDEIELLGDRLKVRTIEYDLESLGMMLSDGRFSIEYLKTICPKIISLGR